MPYFSCASTSITTNSIYATPIDIYAGAPLNQIEEFVGSHDSTMLQTQTVPTVSSFWSPPPHQMTSSFVGQFEDYHRPAIS